MKKAMVIPFFGEQPNTFKLWAKSASYNKDYDFHVYSDINFDIENSENIFVHKISFEGSVPHVKDNFEF